jgi:hypothetical protein
MLIGGTERLSYRPFQVINAHPPHIDALLRVRESALRHTHQPGPIAASAAQCPECRTRNMLHVSRPTHRPVLAHPQRSVYGPFLDLDASGASVSLVHEQLAELKLRLRAMVPADGRTTHTP